MTHASAFPVALESEGGLLTALAATAGLSWRLCAPATAPRGDPDVPPGNRLLTRGQHVR